MDSDSLLNSFKNKDLLDLALTHKSWVNENPQKRESNERLEFLGDAILEFIITRELFLRFPDKNEGYLTALRANLVNTTNLASVAKKLEVGKLLYLSRGEEEGGGRENPSLLADSVEALIGAIYLDQGLTQTTKFITDNLLLSLQEKLNQPLKDAKSRFQESVQSKALPAPRYKVIEESGPDHAKIFVVGVYVQEKLFGQGTGKNKTEAEQEAAKSALVKFQKKG